jgi:divinyl chlorophyllide a 8-vinyl-reductase
MQTAKLSDPHIHNVFVAGATGYIGKAVVRQLLDGCYRVTSFARSVSGIHGASDEAKTADELMGSDVRFGDVCQKESILNEGFHGDQYDAVISCLASRTGAGNDAWKIDYQANKNLLDAAKSAGVKHFILLSAICVQKPKLEFQRAKLQFEQDLIQSGLRYSIVRPTAYFKSLAGQIRSVQQGKPFIVFGNGRLTACKPISENDLAAFIIACLNDPQKHNQILPVGGPGNAITPIRQGEMLFRLCGKEPRFRHIPVLLFDVIIATLNTLGYMFPAIKGKAEFARIGRYYGTESMLVLDKKTGGYSAAATPSFGSETLQDFYARVLREGLKGQELGDHAMFN